MIKDYNTWLEMKEIDEDTKAKLKSMTEEEIETSFGYDLAFGTAGLRGVLGLGTNKMNEYTVLKSAIAIAKWVLYSNNENPSIAIGYDVRHMSYEFAHMIARVMMHFNIKYYIYNHIIATPQLAFVTRYYNTDAGIMVTASHNPKAYNGIKVYKKGGSQILDDDANFIEETSKNISYESIFDFISDSEIKYVDDSVFEVYYSSILNKSLYKNEARKVKIVYSPYNGTGLKPVSRILNDAGYTFDVPEEHKNPDPDFTSIPYPNPEVESTFEIPKELAGKVNADIIIATDPDADRMNICVKDKGEYVFLNGNQVGALLVYWIVKRRGDLGLDKGVVVKTIVTDDFGKSIAEKFDYEVVETLTGFKNISRVANDLDGRDKEFVMGYEESIGYEIGTLVRDKDGISASLFIADMADYYIKQGQTLIDVLEYLYKFAGYHLSNNFSIEFSGLDPNEKMKNVMDKIREDGIDGINSLETIDYSKHKDKNLRTNALIYNLEDAKLCIRPSGTEPKIKVYIYSHSDDYDKSRKLTLDIEACVRKAME